MEWRQEQFTITDNPDDLDVDTIHGYLKNSYWARGIPRSLVEKSIQHSHCFGVYRNSNQIGFGRAVTDQATFAYLTDVFILPDYQGQGLGNWLVNTMLSHPKLQGLRRWLLATQDAHQVYTRQGFYPLKSPEWFMEINVPKIYQEPQ